MFPATSRALDAYRSVGVDSIVSAATPQRLILMLYEGAITAIASAQQHLRLNDVAAKGKAISQAISIIDGGLRASLDLSVGGELVRNLSELYLYMSRRLLHANLNNDAAALEEVRKLLQQLGSAWEALAANTAPAASTGIAAEPALATPQHSITNRVAATYGTI